MSAEKPDLCPTCGQWGSSPCRDGYGDPNRDHPSRSRHREFIAPPLVDLEEGKQ